MMKNETMVYVVKVSRSSQTQVGYEEDVIVFVTLSEEKANDFVDDYGVSEFMTIEGYTLDEYPV
jgi:hypothetical protein